MIIINTILLYSRNIPDAVWGIMMYSAELKSPVIPIKESLRRYFPGYETIHLSVYCKQLNDGNIELPYGICINLIPHNGNGPRIKACEIPYFDPCSTLEELVSAAKDLENHRSNLYKVLRDYARGKLCKDD